MRNGKRTSKLVGSPIDAMRQRNQLDEHIRQYFYWDSRLWHAVQNHLWKADPCCLVEHPKGCTVVCTSASVCISLRKAYTFSRQVGPDNKLYDPDLFRMEVEVTYRMDEEHDFAETVKHYDLSVPVALEDETLPQGEFDKRFGEWLQVNKKDLDAKRQSRDFAKLRELIGKYPDVARDILGAK